MTVEGLRIELGEDVDFVDSTVDAITHGYIYKSIASPNWHLKTMYNFIYFYIISHKERWNPQLTAGLALDLVRGKSRVPAPPPNMIEATVFGSASGFANSGASKVWIHTKFHHRNFREIATQKKKKKKILPLENQT